MSKMIQIRNVPDALHRALKVRSALAGKTLSRLILEELEALMALPSEQELQDRLRKAEPFAMSGSSAALIRQERDVA